jgi:cyclopropane-fatty-acyl-phospholipid synthase
MSGRLDFSETIRQWRKRFAAPSLKKTLLKPQLLPRWLTSPDFRLAFTSGVSATSVCFERELLDHYRLVFEKKLGRLVDRPASPAAGSGRGR